MTGRRPDAGLTLIEVLVSLALFAMIAGAGLSVLQQVLRAQSQTDARLERLASLQRMMHLVTRDLSESLPGTVQGDSAGMALDRSGATGRIPVRYALGDGVLMRSAGQDAAGASALVAEVSAMRWQYLGPGGQWQDVWPGTLRPEEADLRGVSLTLTLPPALGELRRVVAVPRRVAP